MIDLAIVVITFNEEAHIARCLAHVRGLAREIFVVDSFSTDRTVDIAQACGAHVLSHAFVTHAAQVQWALDNAPITTDWVMRLDADEVVEPDLAVEIAEKLPQLASDVVGVRLNRKHIFLGRWIRHGGRYPLLLLRIWRRGRGRAEGRFMDEHILVSAGKVVAFDGGFADHNLNDLTFFTNKHNRYATLEAIDVMRQRRYGSASSLVMSSGRNVGQAAIRRALKERFYNRLPFQIAATGYFILRYVFQRGFLDGREGLVYHVLHAFWYRFLVGAKVWEYECALMHLDDDASFDAKLAALTGVPIARDEGGVQNGF